MINYIFTFMGMDIYANAIVILIGILLFTVWTRRLYKGRTGSAYSVTVFLPIAFLLSVVFSRLLHWYFTEFSYPKGFIQAFTDFSVGSFALPGVIIGVWVAAKITQSIGACKNHQLLLDCTAPGMCLLIAFIRLSAFFTGECIGNRNLQLPFLRWKPLAVVVTDNVGNEDYKLAVFFVEAVAMIILYFAVTKLFEEHKKDRIYAPCSRYGNVWRLFIALYSCIEIFMDSNRFDSMLMRFRFLHKLNPYSSFISLAQVFAVGILIYVFVYYLTCSVKSLGFEKEHAVAIALFVISLALIGATGEFCIQRYGSKEFILPVRAWGYISMTIGCCAEILIIRNLFNTCRAE